MRIETLVESSPKALTLDRETADSLARLGRSLASKKAWWGEDDAAVPPDQRTVIRCTPLDDRTWRVVVVDAVGVVSVGDLQLIVQPKIPPAHLFYLFGESQLFPRLEAQRAAAATGEDLWELLATWYVGLLEVVLRHDLVLDYVPRLEAIPVVRGRVLSAETAVGYYQGRLDLVCEYEEFGADTPLNRVLRAAAGIVSASPNLEFSIRRRARVAAERFWEVGPLRHADLRVLTDRRTAHYADALSLAQHIISNALRSLEAGQQSVWSFLIRTPELIEAGVRAAMAERLAHVCTVEKRAIPLRGSRLTMNPDLRFGDSAVGDVKYRKGNSGEWARPDLNQIVAFAAAARVRHGGVVSFYWGDGTPPPAVGVGDFEIRSLGWQADEGVTPEAAADNLAESLARWLADAAG